MSNLYVPKTQIDEMQNPLARGLVGYWPLDNGQLLGTTYDRSGNGLNGTLVGNAQTAISERGPVMDFDGTGDYVNLSPNISRITGLSAGAISFWFKADATGIMCAACLNQNNSTANISAVYMGGNITGSIANESIGFIFIEGGVAKLQSYIVDGTDAYNDGKWHHLVVYVGLTTNGMYLDGVKRSLTYVLSSESTVGYFTNVTNVGSAWIGARYYTGSNLWWNGQLADFGLWNRELSASEVQQLYLYGMDRRRDPIELWTVATKKGKISWSIGASQVSRVSIGAAQIYGPAAGGGIIQKIMHLIKLLRN